MKSDAKFEFTNQELEMFSSKAATKVRKKAEIVIPTISPLDLFVLRKTQTDAIKL